LLVILYRNLPTGFIPTEDQGNASVQFRLPAGATNGRTVEVERAVEKYFLHGPDKKNVAVLFAVTGGGGGGGAAGQNTGQGFVNLAPFTDRKGSKNSAGSLVQRASGAFHRPPDAHVV